MLEVTVLLLHYYTGGHREAADLESCNKTLDNQPEADSTSISVCVQPGQIRFELRHSRSCAVSAPADHAGRQCFGWRRQGKFWHWGPDKARQENISCNETSASPGIQVQRWFLCSLCLGGAAVRHQTRDQRSPVWLLTRALSSQLGQLSLPSLGVGKSSTRLHGWG